MNAVFVFNAELGYTAQPYIERTRIGGWFLTVRYPGSAPSGGNVWREVTVPMLRALGACVHWQRAAELSHEQ